MSSSIKQVQGTNDSSILSKCSMAQLGYFEDDYVKDMACKVIRRAPIINRGYYIRAKCLDFLLRKFLKRNNHSHCQIVSLGAGFDSTYFRLMAAGLLDNVTYVELDYYEVAQRKSRIIASCPQLFSLVNRGDPFPIVNNNNVIINTSNYRLAGVDITHIPLLDACFVACGLCPKTPTLLLSECVITYIGKKKTQQLLSHLTAAFEKATFLLYEQFMPLDSFGQFMCSHFKKLGSPLRCIDYFPSKNSQRQRFVNLGWSETQLIDMNQFYAMGLTQNERERIEMLELFDEYEEWHLKCSHYLVMIARNYATADDNENLFESTFYPSSYLPSSDCLSSSIPMLPLATYKDATPYSVCAHSLNAVLLTLGDPAVVYLLRIGGYGHDPLAIGHHQLNNISATPLVFTDEHSPPIALNTQHFYPKNKEVLDALIHASACQWNETSILCFGGRISPAKPHNKLIQIQFDLIEKEEKMEISAEAEILTGQGDVPCPRWRHAAAIGSLKGQRYLIIYGGRCCTDKRPLDDLYICDLQSLHWQCIPPPPCSSGTAAENWPGPCFSASLTAIPHDEPGDHSDPSELCCLLLCGGLNNNFHPRANVWIYCLRQSQWKLIMSHEPWLARFSHTAHYYYQQGQQQQQEQERMLAIVGGVAPLAVRDDDDGSQSQTLAIVNLDKRQLSAIHPLTSSNLLMLHNHSSVVDKNRNVFLIGGGGNCFSFGTHLNSFVQSFVLP